MNVDLITYNFVGVVRNVTHLRGCLENINIPLNPPKATVYTQVLKSLPGKIQAVYWQGFELIKLIINSVSLLIDLFQEIKRLKNNFPFFFVHLITNSTCVYTVARGI